MAAISYLIAPGGTLETVTQGTAAPTSAGIELRIDQTTTTVTDKGSTRALKRGEIQQLLRIIEEALIRDTRPNQ